MIVSIHDLLIMIGCALASGVGLTMLGMLIEFALRKKHPAPLPEAAVPAQTAPPQAAPSALEAAATARQAEPPVAEPSAVQPAVPTTTASGAVPPPRRRVAPVPVPPPAAPPPEVEPPPVAWQLHLCCLPITGRGAEAGRFPLPAGPAQNPRQFSWDGCAP